MGKNREPVESASELGEEEEEVSSEETESEDSGSEPQQPKKESGSESESESVSESESESDQPNVNVKPSPSKPMDDPPAPSIGSKKFRSKSKSAEPETPVKSSASKRPAQGKEIELKDAKKSKKESSENTSENDPKKLLFQRLWSEEDEIEILKGMIDYVALKKSDPVADLSAFHDYIKKNLHVDVSRTQLQHKIRRMRKKYENNKSKEKEGKNRTLKTHEQKAYELSKKVWGNDGGKENEGENVLKSFKANTDGGSGKKKRSNEEVRDDKETPVKRVIVGVNEKAAEVASGVKESVSVATSLNLVGMSVDDRILRMGDEFFGSGKGVEGEKEWKELKTAELEAYLKQLDVRATRAKLVLDKLKL